jgi:hypothetical protein
MPAAWHHLPIVARELARFNESCASHWAAAAAVESVRRSADRRRVLLLDARCACAGVNGIGNLFGDYVVIFLAAALTGRKLFVDFADSASTLPNGAHKYHLNASACLSSSVGAQCGRVPRRFDLGAHFDSVGGSYRWTAARRAELVAQHGARAERVVRAHRERSERAGCARVTALLQSDAPWVTLRVGSGGANQMLIFCLGQDEARRETEWPDASAAGALVGGFAARLRSALRGPADEAALEQLADLERAAAALGARKRQLWTSPTMAQASRERMRRRGGGAARRHSPIDTLTRVSSCVLHAMVRPNREVRAALTPLLQRVGDRALVTLHMRSGWADDSLDNSIPKTAAALAKVMRRERRRPLWAAALLEEVRRLGPEAAAKLPAPIAAVLGSAPRLESAARPTGAAPEGHDSAGAAELLFGRVGNSSLLARRWDALTRYNCAQRQPNPPDTAGSRRAPRYLPFVREHGGTPCLDPAVSLAGETPVRLPRANESYVARAVQCAAHVAQSAAALRRTPRHGGGGGGGAGHAAPDWRLYVLSDSPGVRRLVEVLPALRGAAIGCFPNRCSDPMYQGGNWRTPTSAEQLSVAVDLWMMGAADRSISAVATTFTRWEARTLPHPSQPAAVDWHHRAMPTKIIATCESCTDSVPNYERAMRQGAGCAARRFALLSELAASQLEEKPGVAGGDAA